MIQLPAQATKKPYSGNWWFAPLVVILLQGLTRDAMAQETMSQETMPAKFPSGALVFVESSGIGDLTEQLRTSGLWKAVLASPQYQQYLKTPDYRKLSAALEIAQRELDWDAWTTSKMLLGGQVAVGVYPKEGQDSQTKDGEAQPDVLAIIQPSDSTALAHLRKRLDPFLVLGADQIKIAESLSGVETLTLPDNPLTIAWTETWLALATKRELLDGAIKHLTASNSKDAESSLANEPAFVAMTKAADWDANFSTSDSKRPLRVYVNLAAVRAAAGEKFVPAKQDNPIGSLLFSDVAELLRSSPFVLVSLDLAKDGFAVQASVARDAEKLAESHAAFAPIEGPGAARPPVVNDITGGFSLYRDFADWYNHREALLQEQVLPGFDKFESGLANLLPGRDFGEDVLPLIGKRLTFVAAPQDFSHLNGKPGLKLPGMALLVELAKPDEAAALFQLFFQTLAAILNLEAGQQGRQPWVVSSESYRGVQISYTRYLQKPTGDELGIVFNFLPASALVNNHYILSSSLPLCKQLVDQLQDAPPHGELPPRPFLAELHFDSLAQILESDSSFFVGRMAQEGKSAEEAQQEFSSILSLLRKMDSLQAETKVLPNLFQVRVQGDWK